MKKEKQYVESLEEMVYKNRNKEYGSYQIRRKYRKYITISTIISLFLLGLIVAYPLIKSYLDQENLKKKTQNNIEVDMKNAYKNAVPALFGKEVLVRVIGKVMLGKANVYKSFNVNYEGKQKFSF